MFARLSQGRYFPRFYTKVKLKMAAAGGRKAASGVCPAPPPGRHLYSKCAISRERWKQSASVCWSPGGGSEEATVSERLAILALERVLSCWRRSWGDCVCGHRGTQAAGEPRANNPIRHQPSQPLHRSFRMPFSGQRYSRYNVGYNTGRDQINLEPQAPLNTRYSNNIDWDPSQYYPNLCPWPLAKRLHNKSIIPTPY